MTKLGLGLPVFLLLAALTTPASGQEAASMRFLADQSGCVDITAEYMGCLNFGSPVEVSASSGRSPSSNSEAQVDARSAAPTIEPRLTTSSISKMPRQSDADAPTITASDSAVDVGIAIGHLGAP